jgi:hypothetical protein
MDNNKIIGFNLSLNFGFTNNEEHKEVINRIENMIDDLLNTEQDTGAILFGGKVEFIRENNNIGIRKLDKEVKLDD